MNEIQNYDDAVQVIKSTILGSQYEAARSVNERQLILYYRIGKYISQKSRSGSWGKGAIDVISEMLSKELPGLRGFSARNLRYMRMFYEEWPELDISSKSDFQQHNTDLISASDNPFAKSDSVIWQLQLPNSDSFPVAEFFSIGFTQHITIFEKVKNRIERCFYIHHCSEQHYTVKELKQSIARDDYHHQSRLPNNFAKVLPDGQHALKAISAFKDEYLLDYINVEELESRDSQDVDERLIENAIIHNIKKFILTFGKDFAFIRNQYHIEAFGEDHYIDLLFFNRELNCLVAVDLKNGKFKTSYLGQLQGYLSMLDGFERKPHENPAIGLILCKDINRSYVDYVIRDFSKPMGVATYMTSKDMSDELKKALPSIDDLRKLLDADDL